MKRLTAEQLKADKLALEKHWKQAKLTLEREHAKREIAEAKLIDRNMINWIG